MKNLSPKLYLEINNSNLIFFVIEDDYQNDFKISYKLTTPLIGLLDNRITDLEKIFNCVKENIYTIEKKVNFTFKELVLILENFNPTFINLTGYKKLNGSQVSKENVTYILNTLKSSVDEIEFKKNVVHIFNSNFFLDNKKIDNLPIGLFGDFYSHELSFILMNKNDYKNLKYVLDKCNLKIKKILIKSFIESAYLSNNNKNTETFFYIKIGDNNSKISFFENSALKFEQVFSFGTEIIVNDITKITSLKKEDIKRILESVKLNQDIEENELLEKEYFKDGIYKKLKKKLIYEIIFARVKEISEIILLKNNNFSYYTKFNKTIFFELEGQYSKQSLKEIYKIAFVNNDIFNLNLVDDLSDKNILDTANRLVHYGWKKEAIPITRIQKSLIARFFNAIFG
jgi:cell division protein FtsA